jgi:hypothetical protein
MAQILGELVEGEIIQMQGRSEQDIHRLTSQWLDQSSFLSIADFNDTTESSICRAPNDTSFV